MTHPRLLPGPRPQVQQEEDLHLRPNTVSTTPFATTVRIAELQQHCSHPALWVFRSTSENAFVSHSELAKKIKRRAFELLRIEQFDMKQG